VDPQSGDPEATFAQGDQFIQKKMDAVWALVMELYNWLGDEERSMANAAAHLKAQFGEDVYRDYLRAGGFQHLSQAVALFDEVQLTKGGYYLKQG